mmetsp:Transcript_2979/g.5029  ORF Transcript_2979/g.5029 Transcript_2979/m.5029 type:complete len:344 (+) Transcript_2979:166-1197(+)
MNAARRVAERIGLSGIQRQASKQHLSTMGTGKAQSAMEEVSKNGAFVRTDATFRNWIKADGSTEFAPEKGRYHLVVCLACPWASRCLAVRKIKGLDDVIGVTATKPIFDRTSDKDKHTGWIFEEDDQFLGARTVRELYEGQEGQSSKFTVPILYDLKTDKFVSNESSEIIRMLNSEFNEFATKNKDLDLYPESNRDKIDEVNEWVYPMINNGVYRSGFAQSQEAYDEAVDEVFEGLDTAEEILSNQTFIASDDKISEADIRLFVTLVRFDEVYHGHFKCNKKRIEDYPNLSNYTRHIYQMDGIADTVDMFHIKEHYHRSHPSINPFGIVPKGPGVDFMKPHNR